MSYPSCTVAADLPTAVSVRCVNCTCMVSYNWPKALFMVIYQLTTQVLAARALGQAPASYWLGSSQAEQRWVTANEEVVGEREGAGGLLLNSLTDHWQVNNLCLYSSYQPGCPQMQLLTANPLFVHDEHFHLQKLNIIMVWLWVNCWYAVVK